MNIANTLLEQDPLTQLIQTDKFMGWVYQIDYENAGVMTNDNWKAGINGVPHNCFLIATSIDPENYASAQLWQQEVILLRVVGSCKLPMDDDLVRTKIEHYQDQQSARPGEGALDDITRNQLQFNGLQCRVLGTFYTDSTGQLCMGSDLETYHSAVRLQVYKPAEAALATIVNYINPIRRAAAREEAERLGIGGSLPSFPIGAVRYTSTNRLQQQEPEVVFEVQSVDFLARRTAVFGMTRTGKSNMIKQLVSVVKRTSTQTGMQIGQIIYDLNGEYANANQQDDGSSIADVYPCDTERYRMLEAEGFHLLQNNFYTQIPEGFGIIQQIMGDRSTPSADLRAFLNVSFEEPDREDRSQHNRWQVKKAIYQAILRKASFPPPGGLQVNFPVNQNIAGIVNDDESFPDQGRGRIAMSLDQAIAWFAKARDINRNTPLQSSSGGPWFDEDAVALLNMLVGKNSNDSYITGYKHLNPIKPYHSAERNSDVSEEIYQHLLQGKIVILDLSVGDPDHRTRLSKVIARHIFKRSMEAFNEGSHPPNIVIYVEEAHNIMGKKDDLTSTWPRIAKEGAKCRIATVYSTQEVSSIHPNILANTENIFVSHLNNEGEIRELSKFYDFSDFSKSLIRAQDVGFDRIKTLSSAFVIPVQIHRFDPEAERQRAAEATGE